MGFIAAGPVGPVGPLGFIAAGPVGPEGPKGLVAGAVGVVGFGVDTELEAPVPGVAGLGAGGLPPKIPPFLSFFSGIFGLSGVCASAFLAASAFLFANAAFTP